MTESESDILDQIRVQVLVARPGDTVVFVGPENLSSEGVTALRPGA